MLNVYTPEEIVAFVDAKLKKIGTGSINDPKLNNSVVEMISVLPPAFQVLFVESGHDSVVGDIDDVNRVYREIDKEKNHERIYGFFGSGSRQIDNMALESPSIFPRMEAGKFRLRTARHEKGHDIDFLLGKSQHKGTGPIYFFSSLSRGWHKALTREVAEQSKKLPVENKTPEEILDLTKEAMTSLVAAYKSPGALYDDYVPLLRHFSAYKTKAQRTHESFAEMCTHYTTLYAQMGGNASSIDRRLSMQYPALWPHFRDDVLPRIEKMAEDLVAERKKKIHLYVSIEQEVADFWDLPFRRGRSARDAAVFLVSGTYEERMRDFSRLDEFFVNSIENYARTVEERNNLYLKYAPSSGYDADNLELRIAAMDILRTEGRHGLGNAYLSVDRERRSFEKFVAAYNPLLQQISPEYDVSTYFYKSTPQETAVSYFKEIYRKGGEVGVARHIDGLPSEKDVKEFHDAHIALEKILCRIAGKEVDSKDFKDNVALSSVVHLRAMIESGQYNAAQVRANALRWDRTALKEYAESILELRDNVRAHAAGACIQLSGIEFLERYEKIKAKSGSDGIEKEARRIRVSPGDIQRYVAARTSYWDWSRAHSLYGRDVPIVRKGVEIQLAKPSTHFPEELYSDIALEIRESVLSGGREQFLLLKKDVEANIRTIKRRIEGIDGRPEVVLKNFNAASVTPSPGPESADEDIRRTVRIAILQGPDIL